MPHPDYSSFSVSSAVQEEYRKLMLQKRIVKFADNNSYDAETVDSAIDSGEIRSDLNEREQERLKQIIWAKANVSVGAKWQLTMPLFPAEPPTLEDYGLSEEVMPEFVADIQSFVNEYGSNNEYRPSTESDPALSFLGELVSVNGKPCVSCGVETDIETGYEYVYFNYNKRFAPTCLLAPGFYKEGSDGWQIDSYFSIIIPNPNLDLNQSLPLSAEDFDLTVDEVKQVRDAFVNYGQDSDIRIVTPADFDLWNNGWDDEVVRYTNFGVDDGIVTLRWKNLGYVLTFYTDAQIASTGYVASIRYELM